MTNDQRRREISALVDDLARLHRETGEPVDELDRYEANQAILRIENALRTKPAREAAE